MKNGCISRRKIKTCQNYTLRGQRNARYYEKIRSNQQKYKYKL